MIACHSSNPSLPPPHAVPNGPMLRYLRRNKSLAVGIVLLSLLALFIIIGNLTVDTDQARPLSVRALQPPTWARPFGTDRQGRDLLAAMVAGTPLTLKDGFIAGFPGVGIGTVTGSGRALLDRVSRDVGRDAGLFGETGRIGVPARAVRRASERGCQGWHVRACGAA